jgi:hypothetical protein
MAIPKDKRPYIQRGNKLLKQIQEFEAKKTLTNDDQRQLKHLYKQFNEVFDFVFNK